MSTFITTKLWISNAYIKVIPSLTSAKIFVYRHTLSIRQLHFITILTNYSYRCDRTTVGDMVPLKPRGYHPMVAMVTQSHCNQEDIIPYGSQGEMDHGNAAIII